MDILSKFLRIWKPKLAGYGIASSDFKTLIGKRLNKNMSKWDFLNYGDIDE